MRAAAGALLLEAVLGYAILTGLGVQAPARVREQMSAFRILPDAPPPPAKPPPPPPPSPSHAAEGVAAPPNLHATPTEIVQPPPKVPPMVPPPIAAAPIAGLGAAPSAGAAEVAGPGTGAGGQGSGTGSGRGGDGLGSGGDGNGGVASPARFLKGRIRDRDYPRELGDAGIGGTVGARFLVDARGQVSNCAVTRSSGNRELDRTTCELIEQRYRYKPARDAAGRPVPSIATDEHEWVSAPPPPESDPDD